MTLRPSVAGPLTVVSIGLSRKTAATINTVASLVSMTLPNQQCLLRSCEELNRFGKMLNGYSSSATRNVSSQTAWVFCSGLVCCIVMQCMPKLSPL